MMRRIVTFKVPFVTLAALIMAGSVYATGQEKPQVAQVKPQSGEWLLGEWVGIRKGRSWVNATIRITSYDSATRAFKGDGKFVNIERGASTDLVVEGVIDDKGRVIMTTHHFGGLLPGRSFTFNLKRKGDGSLDGMTAYGPPSLSLKKKRQEGVGQTAVDSSLGIWGSRVSVFPTGVGATRRLWCF